jgi:large subunit ribosomal protein L40
MASLSPLSTRCVATTSRLVAHGPKSFVRHARRTATDGDPRKRIIQRMLYPRNAPRGESPVGTYRQDATLALRRVIKNNEVHETIERAWLLHQRHQRQARQAELQTKWNSMHRAMEELRLFDQDRFDQVNVLEDPRVRIPEQEAQIKLLKGPERQFIAGRIRGLFPREMRIPTSTPSRAGWDHGWRSPVVIAEEARQAAKEAADAAAAALVAKRAVEAEEAAVKQKAIQATKKAPKQTGSGSKGTDKEPIAA